MYNLVNPMYAGNINQYGLGSFIKSAGKAIGKTAKKVGQGIVDYGHDTILTTADNALGLVGAGSVIDAGSYRTKLGGKVSDFTSEVLAPIAGQVAATALGGPMAGMALGQVQGGISGALNQPEEVQMPNQIVDMTGTGNQAKAYMNANYAVNPAQLGYAYGGFLDSSDLNTFNEGGTHEANPYGGIPFGMGSNGKMNTVEEGEVSVDIDRDTKYIFSNRLKID